MAISTYDELCKNILLWGKRDDVITLIPTFISLCESHMYDNDKAPLKVREMETISTTLATDKIVALPDGYETPRGIRIVTDDKQEIRYRTPEAMEHKPYSGFPNFFTVVSNSIVFDRTPDQEYMVELTYFKRATPLSETNQTNDILTNHSNVYLFGALYELAMYEQDSQQEQKYYQRFITAIKGANMTDKAGRYGNAPQVVQDRGMRP